MNLDAMKAEAKRLRKKAQEAKILSKRAMTQAVKVALGDAPQARVLEQVGKATAAAAALARAEIEARVAELMVQRMTEQARKGEQVQAPVLVKAGPKTKTVKQRGVAGAARMAANKVRPESPLAAQASYEMELQARAHMRDL